MVPYTVPGGLQHFLGSVSPTSPEKSTLEKIEGCSRKFIGNVVILVANKN